MNILRKIAWSRLSLALAGLVCLGVMAEGQSALLGIQALYPMRWDVQLGLFATGVALLIGAITLKKTVVGASHDSPLRINHYILIALITLLAFVLRAWNLENSVHLFIDEQHFSNSVTVLRGSPQLPLLIPMNQIAAFPWLYSALQTYTVSIFGTTLTGLRAVSVIFGTLTIPAMYFWARSLFDRRIAWAAALLLATFPPHIHFSRLGMNNIADPLFGTLALAFLARGFKNGKWNDFALAGVMLGLAQYFYEGGKLVYPVVAGLWFLMSLFKPHKIRALFNILVFGLMFMIVAAPLYYVLTGWRSMYTPRLASMRLETRYWVDLLVAPDGLTRFGSYLNQQLLPALAHFVGRPDGSKFYYGGQFGLLVPYVVPFFLIGIGVLLWRRKSGGVILVLIPLLTALGNSLINFSDWSARFVVAFPACVVILAVGLDTVWRGVEFLTQRREGHKESQRLRFKFLALSEAWWFKIQHLKIHLTPQTPNKAEACSPLQFGEGVGVRSKKRIQNTKLKLIWSFNFLIFLIAASQVIYYFGPHLTLYNEQVRPARDHQDVAWRMRDLPPETQVFLFTDEVTFYPHFEGMARYWDVPHLTEIVITDPYYLVERGAGYLPRGVDIALFVQPDNRELLHYLDRVFDLPPPQYSPYNVPLDKQYVLFYLDLK
ncbi:MAG: glycosyltransferase family 39 protein [Chitinophagaceae bacterium]|nr:glycosyltransferase family 39 protein [Anaerolineae bacterium]